MPTRKLGIDILQWAIILMSGITGAALGFIITATAVFVGFGLAQASDLENPGIALFIVLIGGFVALFTGFIGAAVAARWLSKRNDSLNEGTGDGR